MNTEFGVNSPQAVKYWSDLTMREALKHTMLMRFVGKSKRSVIQKIDDLESSAGDTIKYDLLLQATGAGVTGDNRLEGNEEALVYEQDSVVVDQIRHAHSFRKMSQQRTLHDLRSDAKENLSDWLYGWLDNLLFRNLCGDTTVSHGQAASAPDTDHYILAGSATKTGVIATDEGNLDSNDVITLSDLDKCKELAGAPDSDEIPIRPVNINGQDMYVVILHDYSVYDLRLDTANASTITWPEIQMNAALRGPKNPIFTGALGIYNNMILHQSSRIYSPIANVRRNLFLGAQAGVLAWANAYKPIDGKAFKANQYAKWVERLGDYDNEKGISVGTTVGMKSCRFNSKDFGKIVLPTYAAKHSG
ncbi:conserved hypothetical protein [Desulfatibacillum aliphaticivorans]|uniref:Major capsid protein n=1 Tax=Desulfatibacillum aliphaticivorans TaxID=218208 RepID=B8FCS1_DESAL|nr:N4-gp56 family major capsid protein [Desulfatibacillum aliphaticivorans]ACL06234.1 conserved hypothetical protein [Desulfatibacillum aliphaticivorans]